MFSLRQLLLAFPHENRRINVRLPMAQGSRSLVYKIWKTQVMSQKVLLHHKEQKVLIHEPLMLHKTWNLRVSFHKVLLPNEFLIINERRMHQEI